MYAAFDGKVMAFKYFSTAGGIDYDKVLKHFKDQASGSRNSVVLAGKKRKIVLVNAEEKEEKKKNEDIHRLEVVDPVKSTVDRAKSELRRTIIKERGGDADRHSQPGRKRKTVVKEAHRRTKRARDVFEDE